MADEVPPAALYAHAIPIVAEPSHCTTLNTERPPLIRHLSLPEAYKSPLRHHKRTPSIGRPPVKETLNASLQYDDEDQGMRINQYVIKQEIGRGSFGAVHIAVDQSGNEYAIKEFSKSRLRRRSQSHILRRPHQAGRRGALLGPAAHRRSASEIHNEAEAGNPLYLIREEMAILKKLDHENVVHLIEVLDDPEGDSLYMVMEMCHKGVIMKVGLDQDAEPYPEEKCRLWFRDMILGIEYLHAQGIVHRDIKPENLLLSKDDVLKIVDFGVSEMFEKKSPMMTAKTAGSPAFLPPELCYAKHGDISGAAADIWSMGVTLHCLLFGRLPFNHSGVMELYEAIKHDDIRLPEDLNPDLRDLLKRILEKDPHKRIKMRELREHPWVTRNGEDMLLSTEENTADVILLPTDEEMKHAITKSIRHVMVAVRAVQKLKRLTFRRSKTPSRTPSQESLHLSPPVGDETFQHRSKSCETDNRENLEQRLVVSGINSQISLESIKNTLPDKPENPQRMDSAIEIFDLDTPDNIQNGNGMQQNQEKPSIGIVDCVDSPVAENPARADVEKSQTNSFADETRYLNIGVGHDQSDPMGTQVVSESPTRTDGNFYEEAYREEIERARKDRGGSATVSQRNG
ncbi:hypothetical protein RUND412_002048 [Rhizina undulata]